MTASPARRPPFEPEPRDTAAAIRAALAHCLDGPRGAAESRLFHEAREAARREGIRPEQLVELIQSTWSELADAAGLTEHLRDEELANALARCLEAMREDNRG